MSIKIYNEEDFKGLRIAGNLAARTLDYITDYVKEGVSTLYLNDLCDDFINKNGGISACIGYHGYPKSVCISLNHVICHGIPSEDKKLKNGDIVTLDICVCYKGYHGDSAWTYKVGDISKEKEYLLEHTEKALFVGLEQVKPGNRIGDIGYAIEAYAEKHNLGVVKELVGHGVGSSVHEDPDIPNYGRKNTGPVIKEGMVFAIEPMLNLGTADIYMLDDDWTIETDDGMPSAHFEHTVVVTKDGYQILTGE